MSTADQTAYSGERKARSGDARRLPGWDPKIAQLFALGHNFLGCEYSDGGWLYRGGSIGLMEVLRTGEAGWFESEKPVARLERDLGVFLISQDFSDAYSVARFWEGTPDSYIAVFKSAFFNRELRAGRAAVLGFAEPGVVFKYPFLIRPPAISEIDYLIVSPENHKMIKAEKFGESLGAELAGPDRLPRREFLDLMISKVVSPCIDEGAQTNRADYEKTLLELLNGLEIKSAVARPSRKFPKAT
jgi:hypothetical protein